jgi:3',5'-cyclic AMP phosphodiesterase CpdA
MSPPEITRAHARALAWATDIHLNFLDPEEVLAFCAALARTGAEAVLVTGDIAEAPSLEPLLLTLASELSRPVYFVLGNHDAYHGSIAFARAISRELTARSPFLRWLPAAGVVELSPGTALLGHDGWADGRLGDYVRSGVLLNDYVMIEELAGLDKQERRAALGRLGDEAAEYLRTALAVALPRYARVLVATHVPPFREAAWHEGRPSNDDYLPHFSCKATGEVLLEAARAWPDRRIEVYCGHTHGEGTATLLPNLTVYTGGAEYGSPEVQRVIETG